MIRTDILVPPILQMMTAGQAIDQAGPVEWYRRSIETGSALFKAGSLDVTELRRIGYYQLNFSVPVVGFRVSAASVMVEVDGVRLPYLVRNSGHEYKMSLAGLVVHAPSAQTKIRIMIQNQGTDTIQIPEFGGFLNFVYLGQ